MSAPMLLLGPLLRYVSDSAATVWVEADRPCVVTLKLPHGEIAQPTWTVQGHHYALLVAEGLQANTAYEYTIELDDEPAWPLPAIRRRFGPSRIRTLGTDAQVRLCFGSCRRAAPLSIDGVATFGADALAALAFRLRKTDLRYWPDLLFLGGDQVYADETAGEMEHRLRAAHPEQGNAMDETRDEVRNFEEYTWLYQETWSPDPIRWLLSTVPTAMLLDDHDLRDDWNTSVQWRAWVTAQPWWRDRLVGALASYWVYQHVGNLSPEQLATDPVFAMIRGTTDDDERTAALDEFAWRADVEPDSARWSFSRDLGSDAVRIRLVAIDSRCSRRLTPGNRAIVDDLEWAWFEDRITEQHQDHLLIASTLPVLLPPGIHHLEGWDEALVEGRWGPRWATFGERLRQAVDLEHWAAFRTSLRRLLDLLTQVATSPEPPASVVMLSGDVHCSYIAVAELPGVDPQVTAIRQLTMSPFRNPLHLPIRLANRIAAKPRVASAVRAVSRRAGVAPLDATWAVTEGPWFANGIATLVIHGREMHAIFEHAHCVGNRHLLRRKQTHHITGDETLAEQGRRVATTAT